MDIKQLEQVIEITRSGSISRAAQRLYISQPNLSYSIRCLEAELGAPIFARTAAGIRLTDFGKQFLDYARPVYQQFQYLKTICTENAFSQGGSLSIASSSLKFVGNVFIELYQKYAETGTNLSYYENTVSYIFESVEKSLSDIGVILFSSIQQKTWMRLAKVKHLEYHKLTSEPPYIILGKNNPLYGQEISAVTLGDMLPFPYINSPLGLFDGSEERAEITRHLLYQKKKGELTISNRAMLYDLLHKTSAYSISSNNQNAYEKQPAYNDIRAIPIKNPGFSFEIGWLCREGTALSPLGQEFIFNLCSVLKLSK